MSVSSNTFLFAFRDRIRSEIPDRIFPEWFQFMASSFKSWAFLNIFKRTWISLIILDYSCSWLFSNILEYFIFVSPFQVGNRCIQSVWRSWAFYHSHKCIDLSYRYVSGYQTQNWKSFWVRNHLHNLAWNPYVVLIRQALIDSSDMESRWSKALQQC